MVSFYGNIFWFMHDYYKNLRPPKNTEQCLEKLLPTQDGREPDSCDALLILGFEPLHSSREGSFADKTNSHHIILQMYYCNCFCVGRNALNMKCI